MTTKKTTVAVATLLKEVKEATIGRADVSKLATDVTLVFNSATKADANAPIRVILTCGSKRYPMYLNGFASMRIIKAGKKTTAEYSRELYNDPNVCTFQDYLEQDKAEALKAGLKFKIVQRIKIANAFDGGKPQLVNECYNGYDTYIQATTDIRADETIATDQARSAAYSAARLALHKSGVIDEADYEDESKQQRVPVFTVSK